MTERTIQQNKALHKYFELIAEALNDAGQDVAMVMSKKTLEVPWTKSSVKELLYRPTMEVMLGKESTTELDSVEPSVITDALGKAMLEKGILDRIIPFPSHYGQ